MTNISNRFAKPAGLSQGALARRAGTSRPTLSAYEHGRKSPTLETAQRILGAAGFELTSSPTVEFHEVAIERGRPIAVPNRVPDADHIGAVLAGQPNSRSAAALWHQSTRYSSSPLA